MNVSLLSLIATPDSPEWNDHLLVIIELSPLAGRLERSFAAPSLSIRVNKHRMEAPLDLCLSRLTTRGFKLNVYNLFMELG